MTVAALTPSITYLENGVTTTFAVPWRFEPGTLLVRSLAADGTLTTLVLGADYTATGGATDAGGSITKTAAAATGYRLLIDRQTPRTQAMDYASGDTFPAESHEKALDRLTLIAQEQDSNLAATQSRALMVPVGQAIANLPSLNELSESFLYFDEDSVPYGKPMEELPYVKGNAGDLTPAAQAALDAANRLLTTVSGLAVAAATTPFDPLTSSYAAKIRALYIIEPAQCRINADGTGGSPVEGGVFRRILNKQGNADFDLRAPAGQSWTLRKEGNLWYGEWTAGNCMHSNANVALTIACTMMFAGSFNTYDRRLFGFVKNSGSNFMLSSSGSLSMMMGDIQGTTDVAGRPWEQSWSNRWSAAKNTPSVFTTRVRSDGVLETWLEDSSKRTLEGAVNPTAWLTTDTIAGMSFGVNISSQSLGIGVANVTGAGRFYAGVVATEFTASEQAQMTAWMQSRVHPLPSVADDIFLALTDSTADGIGTDSVAIDDEMFDKLARDYFSIGSPNNLYIRRWAREPDCFMGYERITPAGAGKSTYLILCGAAGSNMEYFFAERFQRAIGWLPKIDMALANYGHNMPVTDPTILASAARKHYRAGMYMGPIDQLRGRFPYIQRFGVTNCYPLRGSTFPGDTRIEPVKETVQYVQVERYGDGFVIDTYFQFDNAGRPTAAYTADGLHASLTDGVNYMKTAAQIALDAAAPKATPTKPLIAHRRIAYAENMVVDGAFELFNASGNPLHWPVFGDGAAVRSNEVVGRRGGYTVKIAGSNGGIGQAINVAAYQGQVVTITVWMYVLGTSALSAGRVRFRDNGASPLGDGRWNNEPYRAWDGWLQFVQQYKIPGDATLLYPEIYAGAGAGAGTVYLDSVILAPGELPRDFIQ